MEQQLATTEDAKRLAKNYEQEQRALAECIEELRELKPSARKAQKAFEYSQQARRYLDAVEHSELREHTRRLHQAHRYMSSLLNQLRKFGEEKLEYCQQVRVEWEIERRRQLEDERRKREAEANRLAEEQRQAEIEHLRDIGRDAQAEALETAPVVPISVSVDANAGRPDGEIMIEVWTPKVDDNDEIVFSDRKAYLLWIAERPEFHYLIEHKYGKLKKLLTDNRGMVQPPGLEIEHKFEARTRQAND
jgi:hypothetical protein